MNGMLSGRALSYMYVGVWLLLAVLIEYFPWRFLFTGVTYIPAFDITVIVFIALYMQRHTPLLIIIAAALLKDMYAGMPPGTHVAIYLAALGIGRFFGVFSRSATATARLLRGTAITVLAFFPDLLVTGILDGMFPPAHVIIWRTLLTAMVFPLTYLILLPTYKRPGATSGRRYAG